MAEVEAMSSPSEELRDEIPACELQEDMETGRSSIEANGVANAEGGVKLDAIANAEMENDYTSLTRDSTMLDLSMDSDDLTKELSKVLSSQSSTATTPVRTRSRSDISDKERDSGPDVICLQADERERLYTEGGVIFDEHQNNYFIAESSVKSMILFWIDYVHNLLKDKTIALVQEYSHKGGLYSKFEILLLDLADRVLHYVRFYVSFSTHQPYTASFIALQVMFASFPILTFITATCITLFAITYLAICITTIAIVFSMVLLLGCLLVTFFMAASTWVFVALGIKGIQSASGTLFPPSSEMNNFKSIPHGKINTKQVKD
ncbi:uncharacterized protein V1516DRAFT_681637 [Lipomyces oligophaga]|uniref:uncharacterized protein n=1 Tax=Lipomyces oligophaga TaxID=45792 RepID=UPI0034CDFB09